MAKKRSQKQRSEIIGRVAITNTAKRSHISLAISLSKANSYSDSRSMRQRTQVKTALEFDPGYKPKSDPINREAIP
ncbi:hypothetical protein M0802_014885 [Mischocyttarus mexicanus]|nr:hypothetical protein M0802_014885 [Mischocyttarus mexicanus]